MINVVDIKIPVASIFPTAPSFDVCLAECVAVLGDPSQVRDFRDIGKGRDAWWFGADGAASSAIVLSGDDVCTLGAHNDTASAAWVLDPSSPDSLAKLMQLNFPGVLPATPADAARAASAFIAP